MSKSIKTRDLAEAALLVGIGFVLHAFFPGYLLGMKPDFSLSMMFIVLIAKRNFTLSFLVAISTGIFTALTTTFPGGQLPNIIDKLITFLLIYGLVKLMSDRINNNIGVAVVTAIGTLISGAIFLGSAALIVGLPGPFTVLYYSVVLPAALGNTIAAVIIYLAFSYSRGLGSSKEVTT